MFVLDGDVNFFTDRELNNKSTPTELDLIVGLAYRFKDLDQLSVYREQDLSTDQRGTSIQGVLGGPIAVRISMPPQTDALPGSRVQLFPLTLPPLVS